MDGTLIHTTAHDASQQQHQPDGVETVAISDGIVNKRPHVSAFLQRLRDAAHEVVVFTAAEQGYADEVLDALDPEKAILRTRYYRDSCVKTKTGYYLKDLGLLDREMDMRRTVLVDDNWVCHLPQPANGIAIGSFAGRDAGDVELLRVGALLDELTAEEDVRAALQARFDLEHELGEWRAMVEGGGHTG